MRRRDSGGLFLARKPPPGPSAVVERGKYREPAFYAKSRFPNPPAKTLIFSKSSGNVPICRVRMPKSVISAPLRRNHLGVFGKRVQGENPFAKGFSPWISTF